MQQDSWTNHTPQKRNQVDTGIIYSVFQGCRWVQLVLVLHRHSYKTNLPKSACRCPQEGSERPPGGRERKERRVWAPPIHYHRLKHIKKKKKKKVLKLQALWLSLLCGQFRDWYLSSLHSHLRSWQNWENRKVNQHQLMSIHFLLCVLDILVAYNKRGKMLQNLSKHICNIIFMTIKKPHVISFFPLFHRNIFKQPVGFRLHQSHKTWFLFDFLLLIKWRWCKGEEHISSRKHLIGQQLVYTPLCARSVINIFSSPKQMHTYAKSCFWQLFSMSRLA